MKTLRKILVSVISFVLLGTMLASCAAGVQPVDTDAPDNVDPAGQDTEAVITTANPKDNTPVADTKWVSAIFGGGPFVTGGEKVRESIKASGFNTLMIWSVHVHEDGSLYLNDYCVCRDGKFVLKTRGNDTLTWDGIKGEDSSITRIELSVGAWACADFENIRTLMNRDGDGEDTVLYKNFKALIEETGADAINFDDESCYDAAALTRFGKMCVKMGCKVTLCPYMRMDVWKQVKGALRDNCDRIYVQCYAGGSGNAYNLASWASEFGMPVIPGYWCLNNENPPGDTAENVKNKLTSNLSSITGGFMWLYDHMQILTGANTTKDYAEAINSVNPEKK